MGRERIEPGRTLIRSAAIVSSIDVVRLKSEIWMKLKLEVN